MTVPRLVATDLDGTLVRTDGSVSSYTREVLEALEARGVPVVFVTGRPLRWAEDVFTYVGSHGLAIVANGALVWDVAASVPRLQRPIQPGLGLELCTALRAVVPGTTFGVESLSGLSLEPTFKERYQMPTGTRRAPLEDLLVAPALKLLARHEELTPTEFWDLAEEVIQDRLVVTWSSATTLLEISGPGVTKASTLSLLCADLGIEASEVVAFGDMPNDLPMLAWAGTSYAMENAHPTVLAQAGRVAPHHDQDGVARVLAGLFNL